jgi:hypothetical protein
MCLKEQDIEFGTRSHLLAYESEFQDRKKRGIPCRMLVDVMVEHDGWKCKLGKERPERSASSSSRWLSGQAPVQ